VLQPRRARDLLRAGCAPDLLRRPHLEDMRMPVTAAPAASQELWTDVHRRLRAFVGRRVSDPHTADDLAQEVLLRLHRNMDHLRDDQRLDAFAYAIARNAITDHYRSHARAREIPSAPTELTAGTDGHSESAGPGEEPDAREQLSRCLEPLVRRLSPPYREALMLTDLGELSQVQAAQQTGLTVPGMKARVQRARGQVRDLLGECCEVGLDRSRRVAEVRRTGPCACTPASGSSPVRP
jgi:RNA polymerase sigma-70 factor (ECF subfamily)